MRPNQNTILAGDLAALNAYSSPVSSYLGNTENYLKSAASYGELPIDMAAKAGQAIFNIPSGLVAIGSDIAPNVISPSAAPWMRNHYLGSNSNMGQDIANIGKSIGLPSPVSPVYNTTANIGSALLGASIPISSIGNALRFGPGMIGDVSQYIGSRVIPNIAFGAGMNTNNPALGATVGAVGALAGGAPDTIQGIINRFGNNAGLNKLTAQGIQKISGQAQDLVNQYTKGYGGLTSVSDQPAIAVPATSPFDQMTQQLLNENPDVAERLGGDPSLGISNVGTNPDAIRGMFPQDWLNDFENSNTGFIPSSGVRKSFNAFAENPTLGNADNLKQAFNAIPNPTSAQISLLSQGKNFLKNNIIQPALTNIDPNLAQGYSDADNAFSVNQNIYNSSKGINNLVRGTTLDQTPQAVQSILKPIIENAQTPEQTALSMNPDAASLYNSHMNNIQNLYDAVTTGVNKANLLNSTWTGKILNTLKNHHLINLGGIGARAYFQNKNELNSPTP